MKKTIIIIASITFVVVVTGFVFGRKLFKNTVDDQLNTGSKPPPKTTKIGTAAKIILENKEDIGTLLKNVKIGNIFKKKDETLPEAGKAKVTNFAWSKKKLDPEKDFPELFKNYKS